MFVIFIITRELILCWFKNLQHSNAKACAGLNFLRRLRNMPGTRQKLHTSWNEWQSIIDERDALVQWSGALLQQMHTYEGSKWTLIAGRSASRTISRSVFDVQKKPNTTYYVVCRMLIVLCICWDRTPLHS